MKPSVADTVHYVSHGTPVQKDGTQAYKSQCRAAVITAVEPVPAPDGVARLIEDGYAVGLFVQNPTGLFLLENVPYAQWDANEALFEDAPQGGTWHWPERVTD
jgi:hypothetical protein